MLQNEGTRDAPSTTLKQLNIAIDSSLHQALRLRAVMSEKSLREYSEALLRAGLERESEHKGKGIALSSQSPVNETA